MHWLGVPCIILSGGMLLSLIQVQVLPLWLNSGTLVCVIIFFSNAWLDFYAAIPLGVPFTAAVAAFGPLLSDWTFWEIVLTAAFIKLLSWVLLTKIGHELLEPQIETKGSREDSNLYFRRGYFLSSNLGVEASWFDRWAQFVISTLAMGFDFFWMLGFRKDVEREVEAKRVEIAHLIALGEPPFGPNEYDAPSSSKGIGDGGDNSV